MNARVQENERSPGNPVGLKVRGAQDEERRRVVAQSLQVGNPGNPLRLRAGQALPQQECHIELEVEDIRPYEHNPRRADNAKFAEIKESIRASGILSPLCVTRRPGETHFILEAGGNTRLRALQELWSQTGEIRFRTLVVIFRPWRSETHVLSAHLIENEQRGEMSFWDRACGVAALKARLEVQLGRPLSLRQFEEEMRALGLPVNAATLSHYHFATQRLATLGEAIPDLAGAHVKMLHPRLNAMCRQARECGVLDQDALYATVFEPVFQKLAERYRRLPAFSAVELGRECEAALAAALGEAVAGVRRRLSPQPRVSAHSATAQGGMTKLEHGTRAGPTMPGDVGAEPASGLRRRVGRSTSITDDVARLAGLAGIGQLVELRTDHPYGYRMRPWPPDCSTGVASARCREAWWLLTLVSGHGDLVGIGGASSIRPGDAPPSDFALVRWLLADEGELACLAWEILVSVRGGHGLPCSGEPA